jgi:hypothetical protein
MVQKLCAIQLGCNGIHVAEFNFSSLFYRTAVVTAGFSWFLANTQKKMQRKICSVYVYTRTCVQVTRVHRYFGIYLVSINAPPTTITNSNGNTDNF